MKYLLILSASVCVVCAGCAGLKMVSISVPPAGSSPSESKKLTPETAVRLFYEVAAQSGLEVQGPIFQPTRSGSLPTYSAVPTRSQMGSGFLNAYVTDKWTEFQCRSDNFRDAEKMASQFERALDERGVRYSVTRVTPNPLNN